jgi:hypothetical protein
MGSITAISPDGVMAKRLRQLFQDKERRLHAERQRQKDEKKKQPKKKAKGGNSGPHVNPDAPMKGVLGKGDNYARRGHDYLKAQDGRGVYRNFSHPHLGDVRAMVKERSEFPGGPKENFNPTHTQQYPYPWEAHHMLPGSAFYFEADGKPVFTVQMIQLILQSDYNINHGHNIIMLPREAWAVPVHSLIQHHGDHRAYTKRVMSDMKTIASKLQKKIDEKQPHEALVVDIFEELKGLEESYWKYIVALSKAMVKAVTAGVQFVDERVKYDDPNDAWGHLT